MNVAQLKARALAALQSLLELSRVLHVEDEWANLTIAKKRIEVLKLEDGHLTTVEVVLKSFLVFLKDYISLHTGDPDLTPSISYEIEACSGYPDEVMQFVETLESVTGNTHLSPLWTEHISKKRRVQMRETLIDDDDSSLESYENEDDQLQ